MYDKDDGRDAGAESTMEEIRAIVWSSRNSSKPGLDNLHNDFLKYETDELLKEITELLFRTNNNIVERNIPNPDSEKD